MRILIHDSPEQLNEAAALLIAGLLQHKPDAVLGLATGSTPIGLYRELVGMHKRGLVSFREATSFNLDEYAGLPKEHSQSYFTYMNEHLFSHVDLPAERTNIPDGMAADLQEECTRYDAKLEAAGQIDLQILGLGHNGHIGFNEPDTSLQAGTHAVTLHEETRKANARFFDSIDEVPTHAITMGMAPILKARTVLLMVRGEDKAAIVERALTGPITTECPASLLQTHPNLVVMLDSGAGRNLHAIQATYSHS